MKLQAYRSHKLVRAGVIVGIDRAGRPGMELLVQDNAGNSERIEVPANFGARAMPQIGKDYCVIYDDGAYVSWSPKDVFEAGYTIEVEKV